MTIRRIFLGSIILALHASCFSQPVLQPPFTVDVQWGKHETFRKGARVDVYTAIPYASMTFQEIEQQFVAKYSEEVRIRNSSGVVVLDTIVQKNIVTENGEVVSGAQGKASTAIVRTSLTPGAYKLEVVLSDFFSKRASTVQQQFVVPNYDTVSDAMSSLLYVSDVEHRGNRYAITPFLGDIIWNNELPLFVFFELYTDSIPASIAWTFSVTAADGTSVFRGRSEISRCSTRSSQHYIRLGTPPPRSPSGRHILTVSAHPAAGNVVDSTRTLAVQTKPYVLPRSTYGDVISDIVLASKQLLYVANSDQLNYIQMATTDAERQIRFEEFWKALDPTPATAKNEAFDEYFQRIKIANQRYKSYNEGWLTDMGRVYIIFGEPTQIDRRASNNGPQTFEHWLYPNNRVFTFEDSAGFGDFRLRSLLPPGSTYEYAR
jgi:GWxTD domain-containing protein